LRVKCLKWRDITTASVVTHSTGTVRHLSRILPDAVIFNPTSHVHAVTIGTRLRQADHSTGTTGTKPNLQQLYIYICCQDITEYCNMCICNRNSSTTASPEQLHCAITGRHSRVRAALLHRHIGHRPATGWTMQVFNPGMNNTTFIFSKTSTPALGPTPKVLSSGVKRPGRQADHSPPHSAKVTNVWSYTSSPYIHIHGVNTDNLMFLMVQRH